MKKIITVLFVLALLCGCSGNDHYSYPENGNDVLFSGPNNVSYTKNDLYKSLKIANGEAIADDILDNIAMQIEGIDIDAMYEEADSIIETYQTLGYESYIISSYGSIDAYRKTYVSSLLLSELSKEYVKENFDTLTADKKPVQMQIASFANIEDAQQCIDDANNGSTFDMAAANNNAASAPTSNVYTDDDASLVYEVKEYLNSTDTIGISPIITYTTSVQDAEGNYSDSNTYYVLNVQSRNVEDFKDEFIELLSANTSSDTVKQYFLSTHQIEFFDQDLYEFMAKTYEGME